MEGFGRRPTELNLNNGLLTVSKNINEKEEQEKKDEEDEIEDEIEEEGNNDELDEIKKKIAINNETVQISF